MAICWEPPCCCMAQSAGNLLDLNLLRIFRDYTPEYSCCRPFNTPFFFFVTWRIKKKIELSLQGLRARRTIYTVSPDLLVEYKDFHNLPFSSYLAGLIEGDGSIIVPKSIRSPKGVLNYPAWWSRKSFVWEKLSNSRDTLKFLVPNNVWKYISDLINY